MPKKEIDYSHTHFYKIVCKELNIKDCYIGHTTNFTKRKNRHKACCINENHSHFNLPLYKFIRENGGWENWDMVLIDTEIHNNRLEALRRERDYIEQYEATLNSNLPYRTEEDDITYRQNYYISNKKDINEKNKVYRETHKEEKKQRDKLYRENNTEKIKEQKRIWYEKKKQQKHMQSITED